MGVPMRRKIVLGLVLLTILSVGGYFLYQHFSAPKNDRLILHGNIDIRQVNLGFRVAGRVLEMRHEEGDTVRAGDVLAILDEGPYLDQVHLAEAQVGQAKANYEKMVNGFRPEEIAQARAQLAQSKANYENALKT